MRNKTVPRILRKMADTELKVVQLLVQIMCYLAIPITTSNPVLNDFVPTDTVRLHQSAMFWENLATPRPMQPFWASTGLCPPEPRNASGGFLLSRDSQMNLDLIASLTNRSVSHVRIHWLLELVEAAFKNDHYQFNFTTLDMFMDNLYNIELYPGFELMGMPQGSIHQPYPDAFWKSLVQQLLRRYSGRYGIHYVANWRFETWNEPDLRNYNMLNFTVNDYLSYVTAIRSGLDAMGKTLFSAESVNGARIQRFPLYGPAGLFKSELQHPFCWTAMALCNTQDERRCPFDTITFHRKGSGRWASEVESSGRQLVEELLHRFPNARHLKFANDEADPIASWSTARPFQADVRYAAMLFSIVIQHWSAIAKGNVFGRYLRFISHDNAFLSYYPYVFEQRTLLARFQMNLTDPPHVQYIVKPVFSALGMLANLGPFALPTRTLEGNVSYVASFDKRMKYLCLLASRSNDSSPMWVKRSYFNLSIALDMIDDNRPLFSDTSKISYLVEVLQQGWNDPFRLWRLQGKPAYPSALQLAAMRAVQLPSVFLGGPRIVQQYKERNISLSLNLRGPWIVSVRVCSKDHQRIGPVEGLRVKTVYKDEALVLWKSPLLGETRCIHQYEVWFKPIVSSFDHPPTMQCKWHQINVGTHTPFMFYQHTSNMSIFKDRLIAHRQGCSGGAGYYKVRSIDFFGRRSPFSTTVYHNPEDTT